MTQELLERGWTVLAGRHLNWPELDQLAAKHPNQLHQVSLDISSDHSVRMALTQVNALVDHIDLLISNAAINRSHDVATIRQGLNHADIQEELNVNALGALRVTEAFLPLVEKSKLKRLCYVSSEAGSIQASTRTGWFGYCMSKAALNMAVKNLWNDLTPQGFSFRLYQPGWLKTYMSGAKNESAHMEPEEGAKLALEYFLADAANSELTLHAWDGSEMPW
jgi:NAD(P)-dependent dehydrogenase (short-subunit alcohol dehydrogenase family)